MRGSLHQSIYALFSHCLFSLSQFFNYFQGYCQIKPHQLGTHFILNLNALRVLIVILLHSNLFLSAKRQIVMARSFPFFHLTDWSEIPILTIFMTAYSYFPYPCPYTIKFPPERSKKSQLTKAENNYP